MKCGVVSTELVVSNLSLYFRQTCRPMESEGSEFKKLMMNVVCQLQSEISPIDVFAIQTRRKAQPLADNSDTEGTEKKHFCIVKSVGFKSVRSKRDF